MTRQSAAATEAARRLWARGGVTASPEQVGAAVDRVCTGLRSGLTRWVGAAGYRALLDRALDAARTRHPAITDIPCHNGDGLAEAAAAAARAHGTSSVEAAMLALLAGVTDLLADVVGEEMAVRLVEQAATSRRPAPRETRGERNG